MAIITSDDQKSLLVINPQFQEREKYQSIVGACWDRLAHGWRLPLSRQNFELLKKLIPNIGIDPDIENIIKSFEISLEKLRKLKENLEPYEASLELPLYRHQKISLAFARQIPCYADFSEPGTGKTAVQLALIVERKVRTLVICPKTIMRAAWLRDIKKFTPKILLDTIVLDGGSEKIANRLRNTAALIYIINYEAIWRTAVFNEIMKKKFEFVICDESTRIKDRTTKQARAIYQIAESAKYRSIMTGTPVPNSMLDIFGQYRFLMPEVFGKSYYAFRDKYFYPIDWNRFNYVPKPGAAKELRDLMYLYGIRFEKKDCLDLPSLTTEIIEIEMSANMRRKYDEMSQLLMTEINEKEIIASNILTKLLRLNMITSGFIKNTGESPIDFSDQPKLEALRELLADINGSHKVIIWAVFVHDIERIAKMLGSSSITLYGATKDKEFVLKSFKEDDSIKYLVTHPATAGHGLTLTEASYAVYYSLDYSFERYYQSIDRINRIGQANKMTVYHLIVKNSIDQTIYKALKNKCQINDFIAALKNEITKGVRNENH